ncbi:hypothetical protein [Methylobacterium sp. ID0610]|uniref:hypothetical protein n=1 Tax=Methylobacterium carpenticola TaxID=3344827 RepID=UPI00367487BA
MPTIEEVRRRALAGQNTKAAHIAPHSGLSSAAFYKAIDRGEVEALTIGRTRLIPPHEVCRLLSIKQETGQNAKEAA